MSQVAGIVSDVNGHIYVSDISHPRARKPVRPELERALKQELTHAKADGRSSGAEAPRARDRVSALAGEASGQRHRSGSAPPPDSAPPSEKATSNARREARQKTKRMFPTIDYEERLSYFDPKSNYSNFRGFFVLFWVGLAIMVITSALRNIRENGALLHFRQWPLFRKDLEELIAGDLLMCASILSLLPLNHLYRTSEGIFRWTAAGVYIQSVLQLSWLSFWILLPFVRDWGWIAQVFFTLHTLTMFMKLHSWAFYNGHLSNTLWRLKQLDLPIGPETPTSAAVLYPLVPRTRPNELTGQEVPVEADGLLHPRDENISPIKQLRDDLARELTSPLGNVTYPANLTIANMLDFLALPTLCYELEYPRVATRSTAELLYKALAVFGCVFLMTVTSEEFIIPVLDESQARLAACSTRVDAALIFAETVSRLLFPFMVTFLLVFLSIFEYILGFFAEATRFADRQFYADWWNSLDWLEFSREWNMPVHHFLARHVYSASRGVKLSRALATGITFAISALAHELIMGCITRKFRGYGFVLMMMQMPIVAVQRMKFLEGQQLLKNVMFWISMVFGLSLLCALYVLV